MKYNKKTEQLMAVPTSSWEYDDIEVIARSIQDHPDDNELKGKFLNLDPRKDALRSQKVKNKVLAIDGNIFTTTEGGILHKGIVNAAISNVLEKMEKYEEIQIEHFTSHALRATFATRAIEQGMTPQTLKTILGHSSLKMTMDLYAHVLPNTKQDEMKKLDIVV